MDVKLFRFGKPSTSDCAEFTRRAENADDWHHADEHWVELRREIALAGWEKVRTHGIGLPGCGTSVL